MVGINFADIHFLCLFIGAAMEFYMGHVARKSVFFIPRLTISCSVTYIFILYNFVCSLRVDRLFREKHVFRSSTLFSSLCVIFEVLVGTHCFIPTGVVF